MIGEIAGEAQNTVSSAARHDLKKARKAICKEKEQTASVRKDNSDWEGGFEGETVRVLFTIQTPLGPTVCVRTHSLKYGPRDRGQGGDSTSGIGSFSKKDAPAI